VFAGEKELKCPAVPGIFEGRGDDESAPFHKANSCCAGPGGDRQGRSLRDPRQKRCIRGVSSSQAYGYRVRELVGGAGPSRKKAFSAPLALLGSHLLPGSRLNSAFLQGSV